MLQFGPRRSLLSHANEPLVFEVQLLKVLWVINRFQIFKILHVRCEIGVIFDFDPLDNMYTSHIDQMNMALTSIFFCNLCFELCMG